MVAIGKRSCPIVGNSSLILFFARGLVHENAGAIYFTKTATITSIAMNGPALTITATNGATNGPFTLVESTNLFLSAGQWTPVLTNNFDLNGNLNLTTNVINPDNPSEFYQIEQP